jgi:hypothetical protein
MSDRFTSERQLGQKALQHSSHAYDKQLLSKIGGPNTPTRTTAPPLSGSAQDPGSETHAPPHKLNGQLKPLSVPAISPGYNGFRSPVFDSGSAESHRARYGSISTPGPFDEVSSQHRGSYDHSIFSDTEFGMEENGMRELNINDRSPAESEDYQSGLKGGLKRRASSPPPEAARDDQSQLQCFTFPNESQLFVVGGVCKSTQWLDRVFLRILLHSCKQRNELWRRSAPFA